MTADYPSAKGMISGNWLIEMLNNQINPFREPDGDIAGLVIYHLRHLELLNEDKIEFDEASNGAS